ncbi:MAG: ABC transporter ATP-binding protein, partial [Victivallaceae bacterium]
KDVMVWEYLDFFARSFGLKGDERRKTLADIEEFTSLGEMRYKYLASLSKGMKQRVSLGRTLIHNPQVLIMDEPAAGLDPRARLELRSLLKILSGQGKAILLSSHILSELQDICDAAVIIEKGKILSSGKINNMLAESEKQREKREEVLLIKSLQQSDAVKLKLMENPLIGKISVIDENEVHAEFSGDAAAVADILQQLAGANIKVVGFSRQGMGLEELFMRITSGEVQ